MSERVFENGSTSSTSRLITALNLALSSENIAPAIPRRTIWIFGCNRDR